MIYITRIIVRQLIMDKKITRCSLCGEINHNKRTCPNRTIEDTRSIVEDPRSIVEDPRSTDEEYITEKVDISDKKDKFMKDLLEREAYDIHPLVFTMWLKTKRPIQLKELKYVQEKGLNRDSLNLYLDLVSMIDEYY